MAELLNVFITPYDKESIYRMIVQLDWIALSVNHFRLEAEVYGIESLHEYESILATLGTMIADLRRALDALGTRDLAAVADHLHKVSHWETQSDKVSTRIQMRVFREKELHLSHRMQLRDFIRHVDKIADRAEDVADKLRIYAIKRSL